MALKAIIVGASGLIGSNLLQKIIQNPEFTEVLALVRKPLPLTHQKLEQLEISFDRLSDYVSKINGDIVFCCLGSTRKKTPRHEDYRKVDYEYPLKLAQIAKEKEIGQFHLISAMGANVKSLNFYSKLKGEIEQAIQQIGLESVHIYRPSLLVGNRTENRLFEKLAIILMKLINPLLVGSLKKYRSIAASKVADAMINQSLKTQKGTHIYPSDTIEKLA